MSSLTKALWISAIAAICGLGLFLVHQENPNPRRKQFAFTDSELSLRLIEAEVRAVYPEFTATRKIEAGLRQTTNTPSIELCLTDLSGLRYFCSAIRYTNSWKIENVRRVRAAPRGRLI